MISPNERKTKIKMICFNSRLKIDLSEPFCELSHVLCYTLHFKLFRSNNFGRHELWQSSSLFLSHVIPSNKANEVLF